MEGFKECLKVILALIIGINILMAYWGLVEPGWKCHHPPTRWNYIFFGYKATCNFGLWMQQELP